MPRLNVIVACTNRKRLAPNAALLMRNVRSKSIADKFREWVHRVEGCSSPQLSAREMYAGEYWRVVQSLGAVKRWDVDVWVASAGYGLIPVDACIKAYSASLSSSSDCILNGLSSVDSSSRICMLAEWWRLLGTWAGPRKSTIRHIETLAARSPVATLMIVASADYVAAMKEDIKAALRELKDQGRLLIVSTGLSASLELDRYCVPVSARLLHLLGGSRASLNARTAVYLVNKLSSRTLGFEIASRELKRLIAQQPPNRVFDRRVKTDDEVRKFIRTQIVKLPECSQSGLLRTFRDSGNACEYSRFAKLFREVTAEHEG